jgi:hypothetical protein
MGSLAARSAAGATDGNPGSSNAAAAAAAGEGEAPARRKLLLLWFHTNSFEWRIEDEVLPFMTHKQEFKGMYAESGDKVHIVDRSVANMYVQASVWGRQLCAVRPCTYQAGHCSI